MKMSPQVVHTSFKVRISWPDFEHGCRDVAHHIANVPGLVWKAWIVNASRGEAGGVYLFESVEATDAFLNGPLVAQLEQNPAFEEVRIRRYDLLEEPSAMTRFAVPAAEIAN
jgi:hypothetical protein